MVWLNFYESISFLNENRIKCVTTEVIISEKQLSKYTNFPYVLKLSSSLLHKTDVKGVYINLFSKEQLVSSFKKLNDVLKEKKIDGKITIQKQISGLELIIGIKEDKQFGKIILFGSGGIYTEILKDVSIRLLPLDSRGADKLIAESKISKIILGNENGEDLRGKKYPIVDLKKLLINISEVIIKKNIKELDLNPIIINEDGVFIVDARVEL